MDKQPRKNTISNKKYPIIILLFILLLIVLGGIKYINYEKELLEEEIYQNLSSIGDLKSDQISRWWEERLTEGIFVKNITHFVSFVKEYNANQENKELKKALDLKISPLRYFTYYENIYILDKKGKVVSSLFDSTITLGSNSLKFYLDAIKQDSITSTDFYRCDIHNRNYLDIIIPLYIEKEFAGGVIFRIDPYNYLYPLIQKWPVESKTAENLLIEKSGDDVLYLNELRHKKDTELKLRIPINEGNKIIPAVQAMYGKTGILEGFDYRGVKVLAQISKIKKTNWILITKIDKDEIYSKIYEKIRNIVIFLSLLGAFIVSIFYWLRLNEKKTLLIQKVKSESEIQLLKAYYNETLKKSSDMVFLLDEKGIVVEANENASRVYGYSLDEIRNNSSTMVRKPEERAESERLLQTVLKEGSVFFETVHHTKNGRDINIQGSAFLIEIADNKYVQCILKDITDKKKTEEALKKSEERFQTMFQSHSAIMILIDQETGNIIDANKSAETFYGYDFKGSHTYNINEINMLPSEIIKEKMIEARNHKNNKFEFPHKISTGEIRTVEARATPIEIDDKIILFAIIQDVTGEKEAEKHLKESEEANRLLINNLHSGIVIHAPDTSIIFSNEQASKLLGLSTDKMQGKTSADTEWQFIGENGLPLKQEEYPVNKVILTNSTLTNYVIGAKKQEEESVLWGLVNAYPEHNDDGSLKQVVVTFVDISERIEAEAEARRKVEELEKFHLLSVGREMRIIELKKLINEMSEKSGNKPPYPLIFLKDEEINKPK